MKSPAELQKPTLDVDVDGQGDAVEYDVVDGPDDADADQKLAPVVDASVVLSKRLTCGVDELEGEGTEAKEAEVEVEVEAPGVSPA